MSILHARVKGGHIVVDESTDLPDGTELTLLLVDDDESEMTAAEQADLEAAIDRGREEIAAGRGVSSDDLLARVRTL
jgi:hypothetical protein